MEGADAPASTGCLEQLQLESERMLNHLVEAVVAALTPVCHRENNGMCKKGNNKKTLRVTLLNYDITLCTDLKEMQKIKVFHGKASCPSGIIFFIDIGSVHQRPRELNN